MFTNDIRLRSGILSKGCVARSFRYGDAWEEQDKIAPGFGDFMFKQSQFKQRHGLVRQVS
jgi:hypothetical protein